MNRANRLTETLRNHVWCVVICLGMSMFWIAAFSIGGRAGDSAGWVSIILAVVVIVYMFYESTRSERNLAEMRGLIDQGHRLMAEKAGAMTLTAGTLAERTKALMSLIGTQEAQRTESVEAEPLTGDSLRLDLSSCEPLSLVVLYTVAKAYNESKRIDLGSIAGRLSDLAEPDETGHTAAILFAYLVGTVELLACVLQPSSVMSLADSAYVVKELPSNLAPYILRQAANQAERQKWKVPLKRFYERIDSCLKKAKKVDRTA